MANFEAFHRDISSGLTLLFLKSDYLFTYLCRKEIVIPVNLKKPSDPLGGDDLESQDWLNDMTKKRVKENIDALGTELDCITYHILGLPIPAVLTLKFAAKHTNLASFVQHLFDKFMDKDSIAQFLFGQFKDKHLQSETKNMHPKWQCLDQHTKFYHFLLMIQAKSHEKLDIHKICQPLAKRQDMKYQAVEAVTGLKCTRDDEDKDNGHKPAEVEALFSLEVKIHSSELRCLCST